MKCREVVTILDAVGRGELTPGLGASLRPMVAAGWIAPVPAAEAGAVAELRGQARDLLAALRAGPPEAERAGLQGRLAEARHRLFEAAAAASEVPAVEIDGVPHALAWRGRELLDELRPRLHRVEDLDVTAFADEMAGLRTTLAELARRARLVVGLLAGSTSLPDLAPARLASIGLAAVPDARMPEAVAAWIRAWEAFSPRVSPAIAAGCAETAATAGLDPDAVLRGAARAGVVDDGSLALACVGAASADPAVTARPPWGVDPLVTGLLALAGRATADDVAAVVALGTALGTTVGEGGGRVAALVHLAGPDALDRYRAIHEGLGRLLPVEAEGLAALLVLVQAPAAEILDDLRLAAEVVVAERLATAGAEALSLAAKILLVAAASGGVRLLPPATAPSVVDAVRVALRLPLPGAPFYRALAPIHVELAHDAVSTWVAAHPGHRATYYG